MSIEQYLNWEPLQDCRYEYINGEVLAMTGRTIPHNDIALNFYRALYPHLHPRGCRINVADVKVQVSFESPYYYPDVVVSCDSRDLNARKFIQYPKLIIEVLSPTIDSEFSGESPAAIASAFTYSKQSRKLGSKLIETVVFPEPFTPLMM